MIGCAALPMLTCSSGRWRVAGRGLSLAAGSGALVGCDGRRARGAGTHAISGWLSVLLVCGISGSKWVETGLEDWTAGGMTCSCEPARVLEVELSASLFLRKAPGCGS